MKRPVDVDKLEAEIAALGDLPSETLKQRIEDLTGSPPPKRIRRKLLILALAYEMQRKAFGVKAERSAARSRAASGDGHGSRVGGNVDGQSRRGAPSVVRSLKPGGRLVREWHGRTYEVYVAEDGCYLDGTRHRSLSAAAEAITGVKWNGPKFFGLRSPRVS